MDRKLPEELERYAFAASWDEDRQAEDRRRRAVDELKRHLEALQREI